VAQILKTSAVQQSLTNSRGWGPEKTNTAIGKNKALWPIN